MTNIEYAERAEMRSHIYGLLSRVYREEPSKEFLKKLRDSTFLQSLKELGLELDEYFNEKPLDEISEEIAVEYTRLFLGPGKHIYPYESAYRNRKKDVLSDTSAKMKNLIESHGLQYRPDFRDNADHISVELEFMEKLTNAEGRAWGKQDNKKATEFLKLEKHFLEEHLTEWVPKFSDRIIEQALLGFYREMAKLTKEYVLLEVHGIKDLIKQFNPVAHQKEVKKDG